MAEYRFRRTIHGLQPADTLAEEWLSRKKPNKDFMVKVRSPRNGRQHSLYWVLCSLIASNHDHWTAEDVSDFFKLSTGHVRNVVDSHGTEYRFPKSISFASMDQEAFGKFFDKCIRLTTDRIIPGLDESQLRRELQGLVA